VDFSHGFLVLDKPTGITSAAAVAQVKRLLKCKKIGHGGTLDPLASGILPLAIGEATKTFDYVAASRKEYRFTIAFGQERDTDDAEGNITGETDKLPIREELEQALPEFTGTIMQIPPVYSALKIDGERAYKRARAGEQLQMAARPVEVYDLEIISFQEVPAGLQSATLHVACGKGTYVRSLARDIARKCNSLGYISMLRRIRVGKFHEKGAISLDKLAQPMHNAALFEAWVPIELALDDIPAISVETALAEKLRHGQSFSCNKPNGKYIALHLGRIVAIVEVLTGQLKPLRVFNIT
jgi:tRNA pseudouridine55 synthase